MFEPDYAKMLGDNAIAYVNQHYSGKRMANEYEALFQRLTEQVEGAYVEA